MTSTAISIAAALLIGTVELLQVAMNLLSLHGPVSEFIAHLEPNKLGFALVGMLLFA